MDNVQLRLKETRNRLGLTQVEIANRLGMAQATYQKIESGKNADIRISTLVHICKTLNVSADELLGLEITNPNVVRVAGYRGGLGIKPAIVVAKPVARAGRVATAKSSIKTGFKK